MTNSIAITDCKLPPSKKALRRELEAFITGYLLVCLYILFYSPTVLLYVGHDISPVLDGAWRIENGQLPHKDFPSILGYGYLLQQYLFLKIFNYDFIAFAFSSLVITTSGFLLFLSFYRSKYFLKNTNTGLRVYLFLLLLSLGLGQYHFGVGHTLLTYANLYNRYCFLYLLILLLQLLLLGEKKEINAALVIRLIISALLINYLLFVKITYMLAALALLTICVLTAVVSFKIYTPLLLLSLFIFVAVVAVTKVDVWSLLRDYGAVSAVRGPVLRSPAFIRYKLLQYYNILFLLGLIGLLVELGLKKAPLKFIFLTSFIGICGILLQFTNWGATDIVLLSFVPALFILLPQYTRLVSYKIFILLCSFFLFKNLRSIYYLRQAKQNSYSEVKSPYLAHFYTNFTETSCNENYATKVVNGAALVNKNKKGGDKVFSFSFDNPFPFLTQTFPPAGVPIVWQYATTYSYARYPDPKTLFQDVDLILIPTCPEAESATEMQQLYGKMVLEHYRLIDSNSYWRLYRKKTPL